MSYYASPSKTMNTHRTNGVASLLNKIKKAQFETTSPNEVINPEVGKSFDVNKFLIGTSPSMVASNYTCATQAKARPDQLFLGWNGKVTIWEDKTFVKFAAYAGGYPTSDHALYAAHRLYEATNMWNELELGVRFEWVGKLDDAEFVLAYGGDADGTLARAFFPNDEDLNTMFVYKRAFDADTVNYMANIFAHETGHVLGLRHEFAPEEGDDVLFGPKNPLSVMSYKFPPVIQETDKTSTKILYTLKGDSKIDGYPVVRVTPNN